MKKSIIRAYEEWLQPCHWQLFCTLTFGYRVSEAQARKTLGEYIDRIEKLYRAPVSVVLGEEIRYSGAGMPPAPRHFHLLLTSTAKLNPKVLARIWESMAGTRSRGAGADMRPYDPALPGLAYVLKKIAEADGEWMFRNLDLVLPSHSSARNNRRHRRHILRQESSR